MVLIDVLALFLDHGRHVSCKHLALILLCEADPVHLFILSVNFFSELFGEVYQLLVIFFEDGKLPLLSDLVVLETLYLLLHQICAFLVHPSLQGKVVQVFVVALRVQLSLHLLHELLKCSLAHEIFISRTKLLRHTILQCLQLLFKLF